MIYVFLADGCEEIEALTPVDVLRRAGCEVKTVGVGGKTITGAHHIPITCDITEGEAAYGGLEMVVLPGGMPGTTNLEASQTVLSAVKYAADKGIWVAAICAAPSVLGHMGLLEGRNATCFPGFEKELAGARTTGEPVCVDGKWITARGMGVALEFSLKLAEVLRGMETAQKLSESLQCPRQ